MKIVTKPVTLPKPIPFELAEENKFEGSMLEPGPYYLLFVGPAMIEIYTEAALREKYDVE